jgi:hypothetical protein
MQWHYSTKRPNGTDYDTPKAFRCFTSKGFDVMYISSISDCGKPLSAPDGLLQLQETVQTANSIEFKNKVRGFASAGWCKTGYGTGADISWSAMELLAYWNHVTRPDLSPTK